MTGSGRIPVRDTRSTALPGLGRPPLQSLKQRNPYNMCKGPLGVSRTADKVLVLWTACHPLQSVEPLLMGSLPPWRPSSLQAWDRLRLGCQGNPRPWTRLLISAASCFWSLLPRGPSRPGFRRGHRSDHPLGTGELGHPASLSLRRLSVHALVGAAACFSPTLWPPKPGLLRCACWRRWLLPSAGR